MQKKFFSRANLSEIPYDVVHTTNAETISGTKSFNSSPVVIPDLSLGDYSNKVVTSKWVKDVSTAAVYVSPSGNDSNSGMTAAESVRTFAKAQEIGMAKSQKYFEINASEGSYSGDIILHQQEFSIVASGDITISGRIYLDNVSTLLIKGGYKTTVVHSGSTSAIDLRNDSSLNVYGDVYIVANGLTVSAFSIVRRSFCRINKLSISGTGCAGGVSCADGSYFSVASTFMMDDILTSGYAINCSASFFHVQGQISLYSSSNSYSIYIHNQSLFYSTNLTINAKSTTSCVVINDGSVAIIQRPSLTSSVSLPAFVQVSNNSYVYMSGTISLNGTVTVGTIYVLTRAYLAIDNNATISGTVTGKRYNIISGGYINVSGTGASRIPGTTAGTISNSITVKDTGNTNRTFSMDGSYYG